MNSNCVFVGVRRCKWYNFKLVTTHIVAVGSELEYEKLSIVRYRGKGWKFHNKQQLFWCNYRLIGTFLHLQYWILPREERLVFLGDYSTGKHRKWRTTANKGHSPLQWHVMNISTTVVLQFFNWELCWHMLTQVNVIDGMRVLSRISPNCGNFGIPLLEIELIISVW